MKQRRRIYYSAAQRSEIWDRWQAGEPMSSIGRRFDRESSSVFSVISPTGGIRPPDRHRAQQALSLSEREEISRWLSMRRSLRSIARHLGRSASTVSREVGRNGGADRYRAAGSDQAAWDRTRRPKLCKLACHPFLRRTVSIGLRRQWSPEQIAGWLKCTNPGEPQNQVSHETIYRSLFVQARGVLKKELLEHLRAKRTIRRSRHASLKRNGLGQIKNAVSISERPASVEDRAVPGHWERDLIGGSMNSYVATLVERHSRYVMLVKVANKDTESVVSALIKQSQRLPSELYRSLTWDRGKELAVHLNNINHHKTLSPHPLGRNPLDFMAIGKVQPNLSQPAKYLLYEKLAVPDGAGGYRLGWYEYEDHTDAVDLPRWVTDPPVGHVTPLSENADEYDFTNDVGHKHIGSWLDRAAQRAGR
jgi:IS30 family transposase